MLPRLRTPCNLPGWLDKDSQLLARFDVSHDLFFPIAARQVIGLVDGERNRVQERFLTVTRENEIGLVFVVMVSAAGEK